MVDYVKGLAETFEKKGQQPGYAHAVAWSIACKYHPEYDKAGHCERQSREYLTRKSNRRLLVSLHRALEGVEHGGELLYWAAIARGVRTAAFRHRGHVVVVYDREAFGPTVSAGPDLQQAVQYGVDADLGHRPPPHVAAQLEALFERPAKRNPAGKVKLTGSKDVEGFFREWDTMYFPHPLMPGSRAFGFVCDDGVTQGVVVVELHKFEGHVHLSNIMTSPENARRSGAATRALQDVCALADKHHCTITLEAHAFGRVKSMNNAKLAAWYGKHGFKKTSGTAKEGYLMERSPGKVW